MVKLNAPDKVQVEAGRFLVGIMVSLDDGGHVVAVYRPCGACGGKGCQSCVDQGYVGEIVLPDVWDRELRAKVADYQNRVWLLDAVMGGLKADLDLAVFPRSVRRGFATRLGRYVLACYWSETSDDLLDYLAGYFFADEPEDARSPDEVKKKDD